MVASTCHIFKRRLPLVLVVLLLAVTMSACARQSEAPAGPTAPTAAQPAGLPATAPAQPAATSAAQPAAAAPDNSMNWWNDGVFYEVFVRSFYDSSGDGIGDFDGLIEKLDYLNDGDPETTGDLGVTGLWLMPIMQSPSYHGYDTVDYYTVEQDYGANEDFKRLIDEAHKRGIKVIVDMVLNHTSNEHPWFRESASDPNSPKRDWYIWSETDDGSTAPWAGGGPVWHPLGDEYYFGLFWEGMPDLNYKNPEVTAEADKIAKFWLEDMGADGFRLDAIRHLIEEGQTYAGTPSTHQWLVKWDDYLDTVNPQALTVGEVWDTTDKVAPYVANDEVDLAFEFDLADAIIKSIKGGKPVATSQDLANKLTAYPPGQFATFLTNHDQNRVATQLFDDPEGNKLAATLLLTLPGVPFVYYGEEIGMTGGKPDELIRTPMQWSGEANAGFTSGTPWEPVNRDAGSINVADQSGDPNSLLSHYRRLIQARTQQQALSRGELVPVDSSCPSTFAYMRRLPTGAAGGQDGQTVLVVANFARKGEQAGCTFSYHGSALPAGAYQARDLLTEAEAAPLTVTSEGFQGYAPVPALGPKTGYVMLLTPAP